MNIIGLTGHPSSGKDTVADYLVSKGYLHLSTSDIIREEMKIEGLSTERPAMGAFAAAKRKEFGGQYFAEKAAHRVKGKALISGMRSSLEVDFLKKKYGNEFIMLAVQAPMKVRYERAYARNRIGDKITFEQFKEAEEREARGNPDTWDVDKIITMADVVLDNSGTKEELFRKVDEVLE